MSVRTVRLLTSRALAYLFSSLPPDKPVLIKVAQGEGMYGFIEDEVGVVEEDSHVVLDLTSGK